MSERPFSKAGYCDVCTRWYENPASGNCDCGGKILLTPGTQFSRELVQIPRVELEELVRALEDSEAQFAMPDPWPGKFAAEYRTKYLS